MKAVFYLFIAGCLLGACSKRANPIIPPVNNAIVGEWKWVNVYMYSDMYLTPKSNFDKGTITFTADGKYARVKPDGTTENGVYTLARAKATATGMQSPDSILYNQANTPRPASEVLNSTFDFYMFSGDTLKIGGINQPTATNYGLTNEYVRYVTGTTASGM